MVDKAHRLTDESWKKLKSVYLPFILGLEMKFSILRMNKYFSKFCQAKRIQAELLEQGKIIEEEYTK